MFRSDARTVVVAQRWLTHRFTLPDRPQASGKAERVIRMLLHEWSCAQANGASRWQTTALTYDNTRRRQSGVAPVHASGTPGSLTVKNVSVDYT